MTKPNEVKQLTLSEQILALLGDTERTFTAKEIADVNADAVWSDHYTLAQIQAELNALVKANKVGVKPRYGSRGANGYYLRW